MRPPSHQALLLDPCGVKHGVLGLGGRLHACLACAWATDLAMQRPQMHTATTDQPKVFVMASL
jgi:hypothetical protein